MDPVELHLARLRQRIGDATSQELPGTGWVVRIPGVHLPPGWSKPKTGITFVAPQGYPFAKPDCFWADADLRLANGTIPQNTQPNNPIPGLPDQLLWFSWHVEPWNPNRDDLVTWFAIIKQRLSRPQ
jgi:hypothetical protein